MTPDHGLSRGTLATLAEILARFGDGVTQVDIFGSRAAGTHRPNSDIDLAVHGDVSEATLDRLYTEFLESNLPVSVDVISYERSFAPLRRHIDAAGKRLFTGDSLRRHGRQLLRNCWPPGSLALTAPATSQRRSYGAAS